MKVVLLPDNQVVVCNVKLEGGTTRCDLRPLAEALGFVVTPHLEQDKVYLKKADSGGDK